MKQNIAVGLFLCFLLLAAHCGAGENRTALVIGNSEYFENPLRNAINDAQDMSAKLKGLGFTVRYKENLTLNEMKNTFETFFKQLSYQQGAGLFYYAGHAVQINGVNYLLPVDFTSGINIDDCIQVDKITKGMKKSGADFNILILDACRTNPFTNNSIASSSLYRSVRGIGVKVKKGLAVLDAPPSTLIAYSTAPDKVALDGQGRNGVYTKYLLKYIDNEGIGIEEVFKKTSASVLEATDYKQVPWISSSLTKNFYFSGRPKVKGGKRRVFGAF